MSRLVLRVTRGFELVFEGDPDECTVAFMDEVRDEEPVVYMWGDNNNGLQVYFPDDEEPWLISPIDEKELGADQGPF